MRELKIICWSVGIFGLACLTIALTVHPGKASLPHTNFFIKNAGYIFGLNICLFMFAIPLLMKPGFITDNPYEDDLGKAKINFIGLTILMPGISLLFFSLIISNEIVPIVIIIVSFIVFAYLIFAYQLFMQMKKSGKL